MRSWDHYPTFYLPHVAGSNADLAWNTVPGCGERVQVCFIDFPVSGWLLCTIWAHSDSLGRCDTGSLCSAGISPAPEMGALTFPISLLLFCLLSRLCWSFNAVSSWIFFIASPAFASWHWSTVISESSSDLFFSSLSISVFSIYQRQMMLSYVLLFLLHVCSLEQKSKAAIWPSNNYLNLLPFFIKVYQREGNSLTFALGLIPWRSYLLHSHHPQQQLTVISAPHSFKTKRNTPAQLWCFKRENLYIVHIPSSQICFLLC